MNQAPTNLASRLLRCGLLLGVTLPAYGQRDIAELRAIETIEVTGSNIRRTDTETELPLQIITREDIERSSVATTAELMRRVSANLVGKTDVTFTSAPSGLQPGLSSANLRGFGDGSTLILLNGRRVANYALNGGTVNLNFIPLDAIDRVEILKDGASAIYGSDAMAGVINFILRKDYSGAQLAVYDTEPQHGGGDQKQVSVTAGYGSLSLDRFNVFATASYQNDQPLHARDRSFSVTSYRPDEGLGPNARNPTFPANIRTGRSTFLNPSFDTGCMPPISIPIPGTAMCGYDDLGVINILPTVERASVLGGATWQVDPNHRLFAQYLYARNRNVLTRNVSPIDGVFYPADGPYYPTAFAAAHGLSGGLTLAYRTLPLGPITDKIEARAQHLVAGVDGVAGDWNYDAAWIYSENTERFFASSGRPSRSRLIGAIATGLVNPFGPSGPEGEALLRNAEVSGEHFHAKAITRSFEAKGSRRIAALPAGPLALAIGADARHEELAGAFSPELTSGDVIGSATTTGLTRGSRSVGAAYAELNVPIATRLEAQLAVRYDHYSDFGGTTNPKIAVRWQPAKAWLVRASYGTGFRAPTLADLDTPLSRTSTAKPRDDPARCPVTGLPSDCNTLFDAVFGGNPDLRSEKSTQLNVGVVWEPLSGLSLDVDYWKITKAQAIGTLTEDTLFNDFDRFATTNFRRGPADPAFPALPGPIQSVFEGRLNFGNQQTSGVDVDVAYHGPATAIGRFGFDLNGTYVARWQQQLDGVDYVSLVGRNVAGAIPRWRHVTTLDWRYGAWSAALTQSFSAGYIDANLNAQGKERRVGAYDAWHLQGAYNGFRNTKVTLGVKNLFDRAPPFSNQADQGQVMYDPRYADPRGRTFYAKLAFVFP